MDLVALTWLIIMGGPGPVEDRILLGVPGCLNTCCMRMTERIRSRPSAISLLKAVGMFQVWSLTQFYSVDFPQSRIGAK